MPDNEDEAEQSDASLPTNKWKNVVSRHRKAKRAAAGTMGFASGAVGATSTLTGSSAITVVGALAAGTAVSATGIGLVALTGAFTLGRMALGAKSAYSTAKHLKRLEEIYAARGTYDTRCMLLPGGDQNAEFANLHATIEGKVLPWIIHQKKHKLGKKVVAAAGLGLAASVEAVGRKAYKWKRGTLGKRRSYYAECLAVHLITCNCFLAQAIVAELYSEKEMHQMSDGDSETIAPLLADKMKSV